MKMAVFWLVAPCGLVEFTNASEVCTASIINHLQHYSSCTSFVNLTHIHGAKYKVYTKQLGVLNSVKGVKVSNTIGFRIKYL
jgi:hypothetical protein